MWWQLSLKLVSSGTNKEFRESIRYLCRMIKSPELRREIFNFIKHFLIKKNIKIDDIPFEEGGLEMLETLIDKVKEEGMEKRNKEIAINLIKIKMPLEQIVQVTGLPIEELKKTN